MLVPLETVGFFLCTFIIAQMFVRCDNEIYMITNEKIRARAKRGLLSFRLSSQEIALIPIHRSVATLL
jgi:hypothetical protein